MLQPELPFSGIVFDVEYLAQVNGAFLEDPTRYHSSSHGSRRLLKTVTGGTLEALCCFRMPFSKSILRGRHESGDLESDQPGRPYEGFVTYLFIFDS